MKALSRPLIVACSSVAALPLVFVVSGCADAPRLVSNADRVELVDVRKEPRMEPQFGYDLLGQVEVSEGSGCGAFGSHADAESMRTKARNKVAALGGDTLLITVWNPPQLKGICLDNTFIVAGKAVNRWWPAYKAPVISHVEQKKVVESDFARLWAALVDYISATTFRIRTYEKDSGLLTLEFDRTHLNRFVDCGEWEMHTADGALKDSVPYVLAFAPSMNFSGQMNLRVRPESPGRTSVFINSRYEIEYTAAHAASEQRPGRNQNVYWSFATNESQSVTFAPGTNPAPPSGVRTCGPTHDAEQQILDGIAAIAALGGREG